MLRLMGLVKAGLMMLAFQSSAVTLYLAGIRGLLKTRETVFMTIEKQVDWIVSQPHELDFKIASLKELLWFEVGQSLELQVGKLAEDIVCGRVDVPRVVEFSCRLS